MGNTILWDDKSTKSTSTLEALVSMSQELKTTKGMQEIP